MKILIINAGSSSLKYQLMNVTDGSVIAKGNAEKIGQETSFLVHKIPGQDDREFKKAMSNHSDAFQLVIDCLMSEEFGVIKSIEEIDAVGHRVLHGGSKFSGSMLVTDDVIEAIKECIPLGPLHNPANLMGIEACMKLMPNTPNVAVFDTAFHATMPDYAYMYALPYEDYVDFGIRKYGFHGTSHRFITKQIEKYMGKPAEELKIITCHIGNGSSLAAVKYGKCVDTTMGLTPLDGLPMGTRTGALDPAVVTVLMEKKGMSAKEVDTYLNKKSGILGVSGVGSDFRDITAAIKNGNQRAALALEMLCYSIKKYIGSYIAAMGGVDAIVFTAGVGENIMALREKSLSDMEYLGIKIDKEVNANMASYLPKKEGLISAEDSKVKVFVIPTNEELMIAQDTYEITQSLKK
ncbi:MAG: acetate kinase [Clostridiales bacterium]|nr:acetate kinase [Clostridiales bacterium]